MPLGDPLEASTETTRIRYHHSGLLAVTPPRKSGVRTVDRIVLASLARQASTGCDECGVSIGLLNVRSLNNKASLVYDLVNDHNPEFLCLTETWQLPQDFAVFTSVSLMPLDVGVASRYFTTRNTRYPHSQSAITNPLNPLPYKFLDLFPPF